MDIVFPRRVMNRYFFAFTVKGINQFVDNRNDMQLYLDCRATEYINPDVLCMILSCLSWIKHSKPEATITMLFGRVTQLLIYLYQTKFALLAGLGVRIMMDVMPPNIDMNGQKAANTHIINRLDYSGYMEDEATYGAKAAYRALNVKLNSAIQKQIITASRSVERIWGQSVQNQFELIGCYTQIVENAVEHNSYIDIDPAAFFTFQAYRNSGLTFAVSDVGMGLYHGLSRRCREAKKSSTDKYGKPVYDVCIFPGGFTDDNSLTETQRSLYSIIETVCYRVKDGNAYGLAYVLDSFFYRMRMDDALIVIHTGNVSVEFDKPLVERLFVVRSDEALQGGIACGISDVRIEKCREFCRRMGMEPNIKVFEHSLRGVHISVVIPTRRGDKA